MFHLNVFEISVGLMMTMSTTNGLLPRALPKTEQKRRLSSASTEIEPHTAIAVDLQHLLRELREEWGTLCSREIDVIGL